MGGNATKQFGTQRIDKVQYEQAVEQWLLAYESLFIYDAFDAVTSQLQPKIKVIPSYLNKSEFGDIDFIVNNLPSDKSIEDYNKFLMRSHQIEILGYVRNGVTISLAVKFHRIWEAPTIQIDLIYQSNEDFDFAYNYFSYNDLGNLIGRIAAVVGLKFGHDGLYLKGYFDASGKPADKHEALIKREVKLNYSFDEAIQMLGLDPARFHQGFNELEDIFEFVMSSPFFHKDWFLFENRTSDQRARDKKRKNYVAALEYFELHAKNVPSVWIKTVFEGKLPNKVKAAERKLRKETRARMLFKQRTKASKIRKWLKVHFGLTFEAQNEQKTFGKLMQELALAIYSLKPYQNLPNKQFNALLFAELVKTVNKYEETNKKGGNRKRGSAERAK